MISLLLHLEKCQLLQDSVSCDIFGARKQMPTSVLPTYTDVIKFYNLTKYEMKHEMNKKNPSHFAIATNLSNSLRLPYLVFSIRSYLPLDFNRLSSLRPTYHHPFGRPSTYSLSR